MAKTKLSILIPAYMEAENLRMLLPRIHDAVKPLHISYEVIVVDTESPMDDTSAVCRKNKVKYINRKYGNTYGSAIKTAIERCSGASSVFMDGDGSHTPEFIVKLYNARGKADVVIASRYINGGATDNSKALILMSKVVNLFYSVILNLDCKDVSNSFKLYCTDDLKSLSLKCSNFDIVEEILYKLKKNNRGLRILEIPFSFKERMFGHTKRNLFKFIFTYFITLLRLRFGK